MSAPFRVGSPAVFFSDHPDGMQAELTAVLRVRTDGDGWLVETPLGTEHVDERGEGVRLVPLDHDMAVEFQERNVTSFVVRPTVADIEQDLDSSYDWRQFEQDLGHDRGPEQDHGHEH